VQRLIGNRPTWLVFFLAAVAGVRLNQVVQFGGRLLCQIRPEHRGDIGQRPIFGYLPDGAIGAVRPVVDVRV
jgi:hypothetical protein